MNTEAPTPGRIVVIAGFALTCFGLLLFLWLAFGGAIVLKPQGYRVQVAFTDAATLADQADVRTAGVKIGRVVKKELAPGGGKLLTTIELDAEYAPMKADARAILRQKTLLGETYVEVTTGSRGARGLQARARACPTGRCARPWSSTSCCRSSTRTRARRFASGRRAPPRPAPAAGAISATRSATSRCSPRTPRTPSACSRAAARRCAISSPTPAARSSSSPPTSRR